MTTDDTYFERGINLRHGYLTEYYVDDADFIDGWVDRFDSAGQAHMVDVAAKDATKRIARAGGRIVMRADTLASIRQPGRTLPGRRTHRRFWP